MSRIWTSPRTCIYVPDFVYVNVAFQNPIPEPVMDVAIAGLNEIARQHATENHYRVDADDMTYDEEHFMYIDGLKTYKFSGKMTVMARCIHGDADAFVDSVAQYVAEYGAVVSDYDVVMDDSTF